MAFKGNKYAPITSQDASRLPSAGLWYDCPLVNGDMTEAADFGPNGIDFYDDFLHFPDITQGATKILGQNTYNAEQELGGWDVWTGNNSGAALGTSADTTNLPLEGGVLGLYGGTTAIDITMVKGLPAFRLISPASGYPLTQKLWFEGRIAVSTVSSANLDLFIGLMDPGFGGTHITSAASLAFSATNTLKTAAGMGGCIGFWKRATSNPTDVAVAYNVNNGTVQLPGSTSTLQKILTNSGVTALASGLTAMSQTNNIAAANVFQKFGFLYDPTANCRQLVATSAVTANQTVGTTYFARIQFFLNGQLLPWFLNTADVQAATFPSSFMCPVIAYRAGGTAAGIGYVDWIRCAQIANS